MLSRREVCVMKCVYEACKNNDGESCIISDEKILQSVPEKYKMTAADVDVILKQLEYDGYFECVKSEKKGQKVNVVNLKEKGKAFRREMVQRRREIIDTFVWRMVFAALGAVVALVVTKLLGRLG